MGKCVKAVASTERKVHGEFADNLNQFYAEFSPEEYIRTGALLGSLESTGVAQSGDSVTAEVGFNTPHYAKGWVNLQNGGYGLACWSDQKILDTAMAGSHGGYEDGTAIWTDSMIKLGGRKGIENLLIQELKKQGI